MEYPFEFDALPLSSDVLTAIGFELWGGAGDYCDAAIPEIGYRVTVMPFKIDENDGYGEHPKMQFHHVSTDDFQHLLFWHEMYEDFWKKCPQSIGYFIAKCRNANMGFYIDSYFKFKRETIS